MISYPNGTRIKYLVHTYILQSRFGDKVLNNLSGLCRKRDCRLPKRRGYPTLSGLWDPEIAAKTVVVVVNQSPLLGLQPCFGDKPVIF